MVERDIALSCTTKYILKILLVALHQHIENTHHKLIFRLPPPNDNNCECKAACTQNNTHHVFTSVCAFKGVYECVWGGGG